MNGKQLSASVNKIIKTKRPIFVWGQPGIGKSSIISQVAKANGMELLDVRLTLLDPVDLRGVPKVSGKETVWCTPDFLPKSGKGILILDEIGQASPMMQAAALQLVLDRRIGEYVLPEGWVVIAASNRMEDRAGVNRIISPLLNRFVHIDLSVDVETWQEWALENNIIPELRAFIRWKPGLLIDFNPSSNPRAFASPRSWHYLSDIYPLLDDSERLAICGGCVGDGPAAEFIAFAKIYRELPDVMKVLNNPSTHDVPKDPSVLYALIGALVEKCVGEKDKKDWATEFATFALRLPDEFGMLAFKDYLSIFRKAATNPKMQEYFGVLKKKGIMDAFTAAK